MYACVGWDFEKIEPLRQSFEVLNNNVQVVVV